jgi:Ca2+-binding EF-hand superfamily protein
MSRPLAIACALAAALLPAAVAPAAELPSYVFATGRTADLPAQVFALSPEDEVQDVVFFGETRPAFFRFRVKIKGMGYRHAWGEFVVRLHRYLDGNRDGVLTVKEAEISGGLGQLLESPFGRRFRQNGGMAGGPGLDPDKDGKVSVAELADYFRRTLSYDELGVQPGQPPDSRMQALFAHLDLDRDGKLSADELAATDSCLAKLDLDEDEVLSLQEMKPHQNPFADQFQPFNPNPGGYNPASSPFAALTSAKSRSDAAARLIKQYDAGPPKAKDGKLGPAELGVEPETLKPADADGDGALDAKELAAFFADPPPGLELVVTLDRPGTGVTSIDLAKPAGRPRPLAGRTRKNDKGVFVLAIDGTEVEFSTTGEFGRNDEFVKMQFKGADADNNGYLDKSEAQKNGFINQYYQRADRDGDGKLYEKELDAYLERQADAFDSRAMLTVSDKGQALYAIVDADHDERLAVRELRTALGRLKPFDKDRDGRIGSAEVPHHYQLAVGRGPVTGRGFVFETYDSAPPPPAASAKDAPSWFRRMDRNRDGDVSLREFLGPLDAFRRLDADGDGLIDPKESRRAP